MTVNKWEEDSFETLMIKLEECADGLEKGGLPLNSSLQLYEEGISIAAEAGKRLNAAELRIEEIRSSYEDLISDKIGDDST